MAISDGSNSLTRIAFEINGTTYNFAVNPSSIEEDYPSRIVTTQTQDNIFVQGYGQGKHTIKISGNTGWAGGAGYTRIRTLRDTLTTYQNSTRYGGVTTFIYRDYTNGYSWNVTLDEDGFKLSQDVNSPILFNYTINMVVISAVTAPTASETTQTTTGTTQTSVPKTTVHNSSSTKYTKSVSKKTSKSKTSKSSKAKPYLDQPLIKKIQALLGTPTDGIISGQTLKTSGYLASVISRSEGSNGSKMVVALQKKLGVTVDGQFGQTTIKALQKKLGVKQTGILDTGTALAWRNAVEHNKLW